MHMGTIALNRRGGSKELLAGGGPYIGGSFIAMCITIKNIEEPRHMLRRRYKQPNNHTLLTVFQQSFFLNRRSIDDGAYFALLFCVE